MIEHCKHKSLNAHKCEDGSIIVEKENGVKVKLWLPESSVNQSETKRLSRSENKSGKANPSPTLNQKETVPGQSEIKSNSLAASQSVTANCGGKSHSLPSPTVANGLTSEEKK